MEYLQSKASKGDNAALAELQCLNVGVEQTIWEAFWLAHAYRGEGMNGIAPISLDCAVRSIELSGVSGAAMQLRAVRLISAMDRTLMGWVAKHG